MLGRVDLMAAVEELYGLPLAEFVSRRNALAREARAAGDRDAANGIKGLPKPTTAAWVVNLLLRHEPEQVEQILDLGRALREAQAAMAGEELRQLGRQRRQLIAALTRQARALAAQLGERVGDQVAVQVEETLHAAMVDEDAARAVRTGFLVRPLSVTGTEAADVAGSVAVPGTSGTSVVRRAPARPRTGPPAPAKPKLTLVEDGSRAREEAEERVRAAEEGVREAEAELAAAERALEKARRKVARREAKALQLQAELEELRGRVAEVEQRIEENEDGLSDAEDTRDEREEAVASAQREVQRARTALAAVRERRGH